MQRPDAEHVVDLPAVLRQGKHQHKHRAGHTAGDQRAQWVHQVGARTHRDQPSQRSVVHEARVVLAQHQRYQRAAHHGHQRVDGHQPGNLVDGLRAHDIEAKPAHGQNPGPQRQKGNARWRMRRDTAVLAVAVAARTQQNHCRQRQPASDRMNHDGAGKVVKLGTAEVLDPCLHAKTLVPDHAFKQRINQANNHRSGQQLGIKARPLGDAAGDDGRNGSGKRQQKEKLDEFVAVFGGQLLRAYKKAGAVSHTVADDKIDHGGDRKVHQNLDQRIDLIFFANGAQFKKRETGMHGQNHDAT